MTPATGPTDDPRARIFCAPGGPEVFHAVAHRHEIWRPDPFDVETIHEPARDAFRRLVARASMTPSPDSGRILLLMGESGSGKTHLMRAFRNWAHSGERGYCGYMQMTSATDDYGRYVLNNLIDSLDQPYYLPFGPTTSLMRLSTALAESARGVPIERLAQLRDDELDPDCLARLIESLADHVVRDDRLNDFDFDIVCALLYLQRDDPSLRRRVLKYLRCEDLSPADRRALGGLTARIYPEAAQRVVALLGRLMGSVESVPLILCLDQLEDMYNLDDAQGRFRRAMATVCDLADRVPSSVVVISCLEDFYKALSEYLAKPARTRIENDPAPIRLSARREVSEVAELIGRRLEALYEPEGAALDEADPTYPIPPESLPSLAELPTRLILDRCREFRDRCIAAGTVVAVETAPGAPTPLPVPEPILFEQVWNDFRSTSAASIPEDETGRARLLAGAIAACSGELEAGEGFQAKADGRMIRVERHGGGAPMLVAICDKAAPGGGLGKQVAEVEKRAHGMTPVVVRSSDFPSSPKTEVARQLGALIARGGRRVVVEDSDWRTMLALRDFARDHGSDPAFGDWLSQEKPLSRLNSLRAILGLDEPRMPEPVEPAARPSSPDPPTAPVEAPAPTPPPEAGPIRIGLTAGLRPAPLEIEPRELATHAAFLGASGSGKTTVALTLIEGLLLRGIPAILVDRKGDLCRYADPKALDASGVDAATGATRAALRERLDVAVYTPGNPDGRPLSIAAVPPGLGSLGSFDREHAARYAASALGGMMNYKPNEGERARLVILSRAMDLLSQAKTDGAVTLTDLSDLIDSRDPALVNAIGKLDTKHFAKLVENLETIRLARGDLLSAQGEPLDAEALLGLGKHARPGKTRLSIISTKFLGPSQDIQFWVAQLLMEMARWTSRSPSKSLQAVLMFDEADLYLPATRQPPTKGPMENLLKRARSAGLGLMLATQSPGDLDYKCRENIRSWFVGKVKETTALAKMKPMLSESRTDVADKLPGQSAGEFYLIRDGDATAFRADRSALMAEQIPEDEILALARRTRPAAYAT